MSFCAHIIYNNFCSYHYYHYHYKYSLGLQFYNSNKAPEMAHIMKNIQDKYVPVKNVDGKLKTIDKIIFDGDQLTEERARNA